MILNIAEGKGDSTHFFLYEFPYITKVYSILQHLFESLYLEKEQSFHFIHHKRGFSSYLHHILPSIESYRTILLFFSFSVIKNGRASHCWGSSRGCS